MNPKRNTCYGVLVISRELARRMRKEWAEVESPAGAPLFAFGARALAAPGVPPYRRERRPLAA